MRGLSAMCLVAATRRATWPARVVDPGSGAAFVVVCGGATATFGVERR